MRNLITAQEVIDLAFAENSNMMAESIPETAIRIAEIKYIRPAFGAMYPLLADKYADYTNDYVKPALAYFVKCEIVSSIAIDMSNSGVAVANPQYQSAATDKQRQRLYDSEMSKAKTLLDFALEYIATHSEEFPDFSGEAPKKHHRVGGILLGGGTSRNQSASIAGEAFKNEIERLSKDIAEKVDKVEGKGLSTNDFTDEYKQKVEKFIIDTELSPTSDNAISNSAVVNGLAGLAEGVSEAIGNVSEQLGTEIKTKANKDDYYPDMSVGMADNLVGRGDVQDAHINFRPSAGADNITDGAARIERIKGNSVVWNQLLQNADFRNGTSGWVKNNTTLTMNEDGSMRITNNTGNSQGITQTVSIQSNHKMLFIMDFCRSSLSASQAVVYLHKVVGYDTVRSESFSDDARRKIGLFIESSSSIDQILIYPFINGEIGSYADIYYCVAIDLTKMFGAGNEPTSYEEYLQRKPMNIEDEYAYNAGTLVDMKVDSLISTSDNAYDYTKGYARVMGGYKYDITANEGATLRVSFYADGEDSNEEREIAPDSEGKYTFPANGICYVNGDSPLDSICVCLNHSYTKPHPAYQQDVKDLSFIGEAFPEGMRSAGSAFDEIRYNPTKNVWEKVTRIGEVDLGKASWYIDSSLGGFYAGYISPAPKRMFQGFCAKYPFKGSYSNVKDGESGWAYNTSFFVKDSNYTDVASLKASLDGVLLHYELENPIVEEIDLSPNFNLDYLVWDFGTEEAIASVPSTPFRADIQYVDNFVDDIRKNKEDIATNKANIAKNASALNSKQNTLTLTTKPNGNIVIGNLVIGNLAGQSKEFMPATPSGDPMHDMYLTKKYVRWGKFEHNGITYGKEGYWSIWAELGGLDDITTAEMKQIWGEKRSVSLAGGTFAYTVSRTNVIDNDSSMSLFYECTMPSEFRNNHNLVVANLVSANNTSVKCAPRDVNDAFNGCFKLKKILNGIDLTYCSATNNVFNLCNEIEDVLLDKLKTNISFADSPLLSKESLLYMIDNCASNATFTITLHPDVYTKCTDDNNGDWYDDVVNAIDTASGSKNTTITLASA